MTKNGESTTATESKDVLEHLPLVSEKYPRQYLKGEFDPMVLSEVSAYYQELIERDLNSTSDLEKWVIDWSELQGAINEKGSRLYINMTCNTADKLHADNFQKFIEEIDPYLSKSEDTLNKKLNASSYRAELNDYYNHWIKKVQNSIALFKEENIEIETQIALETQKYQQLTGGLTVEFDGKTQTLTQMGKYQELAERELREKAYRTVADCRLKNKDALTEHFNKLFQSRQQISKNLGYDSYIDYVFLAKERFEYTVDHCFAFHEAVEKYVVPRYKKSLELRKKNLGIDILKPWDLACDAQGRAPLKPFEKTTELIDGVEKIFKQIDPQLSGWFTHMKEENLLDLEARVGKAPGGYQCSLDENRLPFIFMNSVGSNGDVFTLLHEAGHSFHQYLMAEQKIGSYRDIPSEIAEVASMSMERIGATYLNEFYNEADAKRANEDEFEEIFRLLCWVATIDAFQIWMYQNPSHTDQERTEYWLSLQERFNPGVDWSDVKELQEISWQRQLHIFEVPFYYIEYGIAQLGALGVWGNWLKNKDEGLKLYKEGLALGGSKPLDQLFESTGIPFDFSSKTIEPLMNIIDEKLGWN